MEGLFKYDGLNSQLKREGFTRFDLLSKAEVGALLSFYNQNLDGKALHGFHASMFNSDLTYRKRMDEAIRTTFNDKLKNTLSDDYHLLFSNFMVKEKGEDSEMRLHQDWTYVEESEHDSFAIWMPLVDLTDENGVFCVMPHSHELQNYIRGPGIVCPFHKNWQLIRDELLQPVYLKAGEAVVWHHRLAHYSPANMTEISRVAATAIIVPKKAKIIHYFRPALEAPVEKYEVDRDFYMSYDISKRPTAPLMGSVDYHIKPLTMEELNTLARGKSANPHVIRKPARRVFCNDALEDEFNEQGYITMDLLDEAKFAELMEMLGELKGSTNQKNVNIESEYELSFFNRDADYRRKVVDEVYKFFKPMLDGILDNYEPLIVNLFNKKPGSGEIPIHQNWTFVDEQKYTTVSVWIPLCDVSRLNGTLEVVPKTHNTLCNHRSPSIPWVFKGLEEVLKEKYLQPLELNRGQIGILDDAILHWSSENNSDADRATIQLIMKPVEAMPLHYYCEDLEKGELSVYKVDSDFFAAFEMNQRPQGAPVVAKEYFEYHNIDEEELKERIV